MSESPTAALIALRRTRQRRRLGNLEWFEAAYRVYLLALFGGGTVLAVSGSVGDSPAGAGATADVARHGPAVLGIVVVLAVLTGLRSGAQGGPMALEAPDVAYVMLSPVSRRRALLRPATQRLRSAASATVAICAIAGQLAGRRLPGSPAAWAGAGALFGLCLALLWVGTALVAHAARLPLWTATTIGMVLLIWQSIAAARDLPGPADTAGSLALWGWRQDGVDTIVIVASIALVVLGIVMLGRTSLDALARRSGLVAQLRFAVTMQDLRTVILLRRQLNQEQTRSRPWLRLPGGGRHAVWRRGWHSLLRLPASRLIRMTVIAFAAGASQGMVMRGTSPALLITAALLFILGLEALEPLAQEVDQPDRTESLPISRGDLMVRHLAAPALALLPFGLIGAAGAAVVLADVFGFAASAGVALIVCLPTILGGAAGSVVSIVRDAPDPLASSSQQAFLPPEMAGFSTAMRMAIPFVISAIGTLNVLLIRQAAQRGGSTVGAALRGALGTLLIVAATAWWVRKRDDIKRSLREFMSGSRAYAAQQRSPR